MSPFCYRCDRQSRDSAQRHVLPRRVVYGKEVGNGCDAATAGRLPWRLDLTMHGLRNSTLAPASSTPEGVFGMVSVVPAYKLDQRQEVG